MTDENRACQWPANLPKPVLPAERIERRDAREHRQQILEVAQRLFAEHGVDVVSMHQIAVAAGIGQGTLYRRYAHKGELCMDLLQEHHRQFVEEVATFFSATKSSPALERLKGLLTRIIAFLEKQGALLGPVALAEPMMQCEGGNFSRHLSAQSSFFTWWYEVSTGLFTEAVERGELPPLDVAYTAEAILMNIYPPFYRFQREERGFSPERILQGLCHIYIDGLRTPQDEMSR